MAAIISAIAASAVAFFVVHRWSLAGTLTGAAVIPIVYTLVSHWSAECLDHLGKWTRRRVLRRESIDDSIESTVESARLGARQHLDLPGSEGDVAEKPSMKRRSSKLQWSLALFTSLALGVSIYSLVLSQPVEKTIVRETVIEKTVTVTTPGTPGTPRGDSVAQASDAGPSATTTSSSEEPGTAPIEPTTTNSSEGAIEVETSSTTTSTDEGQVEEPVSTTATVPTTTTSLP